MALRDTWTELVTDSRRRVASVAMLSPITDVERLPLPSAVRHFARWIQVCEGAGLDAAMLDVGVDVGASQPDDPADLVRGQLAAVDNPVEGYKSDPQTPRRRRSAHPVVTRVFPPSTVDERRQPRGCSPSNRVCV